jgi:hypothetical protein
MTQKSDKATFLLSKSIMDAGMAPSAIVPISRPQR